MKPTADLAIKLPRFVRKALGLLLVSLLLLPHHAYAAEAAFSYLTHFTGTTVWTAPESGWYRVHAYGQGGKGSAGYYIYVRASSDNDKYYRYGMGAGGGSGGYVMHQVYLKKGESLHINIDSTQTKVVGSGTNLVAGAGGNGQTRAEASIAYYGEVRTSYSGALTGGIGGTASGGNKTNLAGSAGVNGRVERSLSDLKNYPSNNGATSSGPYGGVGGIGGYNQQMVVGESKTISGNKGFGAGGGGGGYGDSNSDPDGGTGAPGGVVIEALRPSSGDQVTVLLENKTSGMSPTVQIQAYTAAANNIWEQGGELKVNAAPGSTLTLTAPADAPEPTLQSYRWIKPAGSYPLSFETGLSPSTLSASAGDYIIVSCWYRSGSALASGSLSTGIYSGSSPAAVTPVASRSTFVPDNTWQRYFAIYRADSNITNLEIKGPAINFAQSMNMELNGVTWQIIPGSSGWTTGLETKKWAWGKQNTAFFATYGAFFSGETFEISGQNGWISVYARSIAGKEKVEHLYVENVITDTTPPTKPIVTALPAGWTNQSVTVNVSSTDSETGIAKLQYSEDSTRWVDMSVTGNTAQYVFPAANRNQLYYFRAMDGAGNTSTFTTLQIRQDILPPTVSAVDVPLQWTGEDKTITIQGADTGGSGVSSYAVTTTGALPSVWQDSPSFTLPAGNFRAWVMDAAGNISGEYGFTVTKIDKEAPTIGSVLVPSGWAQSSTVTVTAYDSASGLKDYAISQSSNAPAEGWQSSGSFTLTENGTYYAFARDQVGNISVGREFTVSQVDTESPVISPIEVPDGWAAKKEISIAATDTGSGIKEYSISPQNQIPAIGWQPSNTFCLTLEGTYYAFVRDRAGNTSVGTEFTVTQVDTQKPVINTVQLPTDWGQAITASIVAEDAGSGIAAYAISQYSFVPGSGWQAEPTFSITRNGDYYAFVKDAVGHVSDAVPFTVSKVDTEKPVITAVTLPTQWCSSGILTIEATDNTGSVKDYALSDSSAIPTDGWQTSPIFTLTSNGTYYAFARDEVGNVSSGRYCYVTKIDTVPPEIASITYSTDNTTITVQGKDDASGVACIYLDDAAYTGSFASAELAQGTKYVRIVVEDTAGNKSAEVKERIPGWYDELETLTILPVEFTENNQQATITVVSSGEAAIRGIYINDKLKTGNPVTVLMSAGTQYLNLQAVDVNGDRSILYEVRVPGWNTVVNTLSIADVQFSTDNTTAKITAVESGGRGLKGIRVNGELFPDNPLVYDIPNGVRHLEIQAEDNFGDRSPLIRRRVPGWSEVVTTLSVTDVTFLDYNKTAKITATATGGDSVSGIYVNDVLFEGNPVIYQVPKGSEVLHIQAVNSAGDRSPMLNKTVPIDMSKSTLKLYIENPGWTSSSKAKVKITAEDVNQITKVMVRTAEQKEWTDITESRYLYITSDTTVFASVQNEKGEIKEANEFIECFDQKAPSVTAAQDRNTINIRATDDTSGVARILVNNREYTGEDIDGGKLTWQIPEGTSLVVVKAEDYAGNTSRAVEIPLQTLVNAVPVIRPEPPQSSEPQLEETGVPDPQPEPVPEPESLPELPPEPESEPMISPEPDPEPISPVAQATTAAVGIGTPAVGGVWYYLRKKILSKPVEALEALSKRLFYDESEFGGVIDPLDKLNHK